MILFYDSGDRWEQADDTSLLVLPSLVHLTRYVRTYIGEQGTERASQFARARSTSFTLIYVPHMTHSDYYQWKGGNAHVVLHLCMVVLSYIYTQSTTRIELAIKLHTA